MTALRITAAIVSRPAREVTRPFVRGHPSIPHCRVLFPPTPRPARGTGARRSTAACSSLRDIDDLRPCPPRRPGGAAAAVVDGERTEGPVAAEEIDDETPHLERGEGAEHCAERQRRRRNDHVARHGSAPDRAGAFSLDEAE